MGLISFIKDAGEKLFGHANAATPPAATTAAAPSTDDLNAKAGAAIKTYIETQKLGITGLTVTYDGAATKVTLAGQAPTQEASEKAALAAGNVSSVTQVDNQLTVAAAAPDSQYHDVVKGDTLSAIAKKYYGNGRKYLALLEANSSQLTHPDKIYPGMVVNVPALG